MRAFAAPVAAAMTLLLSLGAAEATQRPKVRQFKPSGNEGSGAHGARLYKVRLKKRAGGGLDGRALRPALRPSSSARLPAASPVSTTWSSRPRSMPRAASLDDGGDVDTSGRVGALGVTRAARPAPGLPGAEPGDRDVSPTHLASTTAWDHSMRVTIDKHGVPQLVLISTTDQKDVADWATAMPGTRNSTQTVRGPLHGSALPREAAASRIAQNADAGWLAQMRRSFPRRAE